MTADYKEVKKHPKKLPEYFQELIAYAIIMIVGLFVAGKVLREYKRR